jgi:hypothetical protein
MYFNRIRNRHNTIRVPPYGLIIHNSHNVILINNGVAGFMILLLRYRPPIIVAERAMLTASAAHGTNAILQDSGMIDQLSSVIHSSHLGGQVMFKLILKHGLTDTIFALSANTANIHVIKSAPRTFRNAETFSRSTINLRFRDCEWQTWNAILLIVPARAQIIQKTCQNNINLDVICAKVPPIPTSGPAIPNCLRDIRQHEPTIGRHIQAKATIIQRSSTVMSAHQCSHASAAMDAIPGFLQAPIRRAIANGHLQLPPTLSYTGKIADHWVVDCVCEQSGTIFKMIQNFIVVKEASTTVIPVGRGYTRMLPGVTILRQNASGATRIEVHHVHNTLPSSSVACLGHKSAALMAHRINCKSRRAIEARRSSVSANAGVGPYGSQRSRNRGVTAARRSRSRAGTAANADGNVAFHICGEVSSNTPFTIVE